MNEQNYAEDEISLRELIEVLLKQKVLIGIIALGVTLLSAIFTFGYLAPSYESSAFVALSLDSELNTSYGSYTLPMRDVTEYIELVKNPQAVQLALKQLDSGLSGVEYITSIDTEIMKDSNSFWIKATANSPEAAYQRALACLNGYLEITDVVHGRMITEHFYYGAMDRQKELVSEIQSNAELIIQNRELLENTDKTYMLESALLSQAEYALWQASNANGSVANLKNDTIVSQQLNPSYQRVQEQITSLELSGITLNNQLEEVEKDLAELGNDKEMYAKYDTSLSQEDLNPERLQISKSLISVINQPEINIQKVSPNNTMNLAIGLVLGLMLGVFIAFFKHYWQQQG
jgi:capsular polysaccharide biosynthesis protein